MINTFAIPLRFKTLRLSSGESFALAWTSGTTKYNAIATSNPNVPTERKGRGKPPMLYNADPNAGPVINRFLSYYGREDKDELEVLSY